MKVIHWNMGSYFANFEELKILINESNNPECLCLQETRHTNPTTIYPPSGYSVIPSRKARDDESERGVALLINKTVNFEPFPLTLPEKIEAVAARLWLDSQYHTICSIYLSPSIRYAKEDLTPIINQLPKPFLLLGDMNAKHPTWGEPANNNGRIFDQLLSEHDIALLNAETKTHFSIQHGTYSLIDLSIVNIEAITDFTCLVGENRYGSDHFPVVIEKPTIHLDEEAPLRFKTEKADWPEFKNRTKNYPSYPNNADINQKVDHLTNFILEAAYASIPTSSRPGNGKIPVPWFNEECRRVHRERKRAERALQRVHTTANVIACRRLNALCRYTFKNAKRDSWMKYISSINANTKPGQIWKRINKIKGKYNTQPKPLLRKQNDSLTDDPKTTSNMFAESLATISGGSKYSESFRRYKEEQERRQLNFSGGSDCAYNEPLTMEELQDALSSVKDSCPGHDSITYSMLKNSDESLKFHILEIFNEIFLGGIFPAAWRISTIIPIAKPNKDHSDLQNYRPISLTCCLCKLLERMVNRRLVWHLEKGEYLSPAQSGFRRGRSTTDCLTQLASDAEEAITSKNHTIAVFFDLEKAYDLAWKHFILQKLREVELKGKLPLFIKNFLSNRIIRVRIKTTHSRDREMNEGVPQGSVLSCTLFALAINDVTKCIPKETKLTLYVDDLTIYASGRREIGIVRQLQTAIRHLEEWSSKTGFKFSVDKTVALHICRKRNCGKSTGPLLLNSTQIDEKDSHKYLGLIFDKSLTWNRHVDYLRAVCRKRLNLLKHLSHLTWGADSKSLTRIYDALIKSKIEYGIEAYGSAAPSILGKLDSLQNEALRIATGAFKCTKIASLEVLSGVIPLDLSRQLKLGKYALRVWSNHSNPTNRILRSQDLTQPGDANEPLPTLFAQRSIQARHAALIREYQLDYSLLWPESPPDFPPWKVTNISPCADVIQHAKRSISDRALKIIFTAHLESHDQGEFKAYTDGSKTGGGVAYAMVGKPPHGPSIIRKNRIHGCNSIFAAELHAILSAIEIGSLHSLNEGFIVTDSKSSIQAVVSPFSKNPLVCKIQKKAYDSDKKFRLCWVPSHVGIAGNEVADKLARDSTEATQVLESQILRADLEADIKRKIRASWLNRWTAISENLNHFRQVTNKITPLPTASTANRSWEIKLARLRLGYTRLTHGYLMSGGQRPVCDRCQDEVQLTVKHFLVECPYYRTARIRTFCRSGLTLREVLNEGDTSHGGPLYNFLSGIALLDLL